MSIRHSPKEYIAPYEMLTEWDEVLLGDEELFREMIEAHMPLLLKAARRAIDCERRLGNLQPDLLQPEELVGETLIVAWEARHGRNVRRPLKDWLLEMQHYTLQKIINEEKELHEPIVVSLEAFASLESINDDESELLELIEQPVRDRWEDIIPEEQEHPIAA
jgi:RNA polymerase sigma-70 factor (ECF subfamily)